MPDEIGQEPADTTSEVTTETAAPEVEGNSHEEPTQPNPFWGEVQKVVPDNLFRVIKPHLDNADAEARRRITELNERYTPWKSFADQGRTPEDVQRAFSVVERLNDPEYQVQLYESLGNFLRENGRLPNEQELQQQVEDDADLADTPDPRDEQIAQLQAQQEQVLSFLQQQMQAQEAAEADSWVEQQFAALKQAHPNYTDDDAKEVTRIAASLVSQGVDAEQAFEKAAAHFDSLAQRIRTAPRPNDNAPRLPSGPGGGTPTPGGDQQHAMSRAERREAVVARLAANRQ